jgi:hypothetical protein
VVMVVVRRKADGSVATGFDFRLVALVRFAVLFFVFAFVFSGIPQLKICLNKLVKRENFLMV